MVLSVSKYLINVIFDICEIGRDEKFFVLKYVFD